MSPRYSYPLRNAHQHPLHMHPLQELQEKVEEEAGVEEEAEEAEVEEEAEADKQTPLPCLASDSAETLLKYSQEKERKQIASSHNSNATI